MSGDMGTPLHIAASNGHAYQIRLLIERGAVVNQENSDRMTPLSRTVEEGHEEIVRILLQCKSTISYEDLHLAAGNGYSNILELLLENFDKDIDVFLPVLISFAIESNDIDIVDLLFHFSSNIYISDVFNKFSNVVFSLVSKGRLEIVKRFIDQGVDMNVRNNEGKTMLIIAASNGQLEMCQMLVEGGADVYALDNDGLSALCYAQCHEHSDLTKYLTHCIKTTNITKTTSKKLNLSLFDEVDVHEATVLLSNEDADIENGDGLRPLHFAARRGLVDLAQLLIESSATVDATDSAGNTPLHEAARRGLEITKVLVEHMKKVNVQNIKGYTPLHEAMQAKHYDVALFLIENGADIEMADSWMNTPFHYTWFQDLFERLSKSKCLISITHHLSKSVQLNVMGLSALGRMKSYIGCINESDKNKISWPLNKFSDVDIFGNTELHRVVGVYQASQLSPLCVNSGKAVCALLESSEANLHAQNVFGQTPLHVAQNLASFNACLRRGRERSLRTTDNLGRNIWHLLTSQTDVKQIVECIEKVVPSVAITGLEATDAFGRTALHYAVMPMDGDLWYAEWLLNKANACEIIQDCYGREPVHYLKYFRHNGIVEKPTEVIAVIRPALPSDPQDVRLRVPLSEAISMYTIGRVQCAHLSHGFSLQTQYSTLLRNNLFVESRFLVRTEFQQVIKCFTNNQPDKLIFSPQGWQNLKLVDFLFQRFSDHKYPYWYSDNDDSSIISQRLQNFQNGLLSEATDSCNSSEQIFESITNIINKFVMNLVRCVAEIDQRFQGRLVSVGSINDMTKVDLCDEFDFIVVLERFGDLITVTEFPSSPLGFVLLRMAEKNQRNTTFSEFFIDDFTLNTRLVKFRFEALVKRALKSLKIQKENDCLRFVDTVRGEKVIYTFSPDRLATNIRVKFTEPIDGQQIFHEVSIDIVPAISKANYWPADAAQNIEQVLRLVFPSVPRQCYLVFDQPQKKHPWVGWTSPHARVDFSVIESNVIRACPPVVRAACVVVKQLVQHFCDFKFFKSYVIKAALMHCILVDSIPNKFCSDYDVQDDHGINKNDDEFKNELALLVQKIMRRLMCFVLQDFVPSVFMPRFVLPVCSFEPYVKFSHMKLHHSGMGSYKDLIDSILTSDGEISNKLIDSQFENVIKVYVITHLMYWFVRPIKSPRNIHFPAINPLHEEDYWSHIKVDECDEMFKFDCAF